MNGYKKRVIPDITSEEVSRLFVIIAAFLVGLFIGFGSNLDNFRDVKEKNDDENRTTLSSESATDTLVTSTNNVNSDAQSSNLKW